MKISVGKLAGFCGGVTNSVNKSNELINRYGKMYCLGELVHNKQVVEELESKGICFVENLNDIPSGSNVIVRAHGIPLETYYESAEKNINLFDLTCPKVLAIHKLARSLVEKKFFIVLIAQRKHPEAVGTISFCGENSMIFEDENDLDELEFFYKKSGLKNIVILSQTTFSVNKFNKYCELIKSKFNDVKVYNTICLATSKRQEETEKLSKSTDAMVIIGGANSSNTKKLFEVSKANNENTFIVQTVNELKDYDFTNYDHIGVMAGASTPTKSIIEVIKYLKEII